MSPEAEDLGTASRRIPGVWPLGDAERLYGACEVAWIIAIFFLFGSGAAPEINEAHYWSRAKYFWDPSFCPRDFFLASQDAHLVFFSIFGWITRWMSLPFAAWAGRFIGWTLLAIAWQRLSWAVTPRRGLSLLTATLWATLVQRCHMSGEWIIGGVEGKVVAYALVIWGLSFLAQGRYGLTWVLEGLAAAFHVLVGGWAVLMTLLAAAASPAGSRAEYWRSWPGLLIGGVCSLAGLLPALHLYADVAPEVTRQAAEIYVFDRLAHHLLIREFNPVFILRHLGLVAMFAVLWLSARRDARFARVGRVVWAAIALAATGILLEFVTAHAAGEARWMRYYWYRATDVFVPLGVALAVGLLLLRFSSQRPRRAAYLLTTIVLMLSANLLVTVVDLHTQTVSAADRQGGVRSRSQQRDWQDVCAWVRSHLPDNAVCLTPVDHQTFKWYAQRAELVTWKDIPQDAASIVEWSNRLGRVRDWQGCISPEESARQFAQLVRDYGFDYVVVCRPSSFPVPALPLLYQNTHYAVLTTDAVRTTQREAPE